MKTRLSAIFACLATALVLVGQSVTVSEARVVGAYQPIYTGIEYATGSDTVPRLMKAFALRVDLQNPNVHMYASHDNGGSPYEVAIETANTFLSNHGLRAAVNASFFNAGLSPNTDVWGLLVSNGTVVSAPDYGAPFNSQLVFTSTNDANIYVTNTIPAGTYNAVAGAEMLLSNGQISSLNTDPQPRTAMGLSADRRFLIMVCVDGRQSGWSDGADHPDMARWLLDFGAWNGLLMDGGGSTVMVRQDIGTCNRPCYGYVRSVGAHLGVSAPPIINPSYTFDADCQSWYPGGGVSGFNWATPPGWPGCMYFDQTGNDCNVLSPSCNFVGPWAGVVYNINVYPQSGTTASHEAQMYYKTVNSNVFSSDKASSVVSFSAQNAWATINLPINSANYWGQTINQLRLDFDGTNHGNRWIVNHIVRQNQFWWHFASDTMGWTAGNSLTTPWWAGGSWPGCLVTDQTGNDAYLMSPGIPVNSEFPYHFIGGRNDKINVRVYPQSGNSANHDMAVYWTHTGDGAMNEAKSTHVTFTGQGQWCDVTIPVGTNTNWENKKITQIRLDFDGTNHGTRWIVDYIRSTH